MPSHSIRYFKNFEKTGVLPSGIKTFFMVTLGVLLLDLSAQWTIPWTPVPLTFQSTTAILIGWIYGPRLGGTAVLFYLLCGAMGWPVFAEYSGGWAILFGPTGGYLLGFLPAAVLAGYLAKWVKQPAVLNFIFIGSLSTGIIFLSGWAMLSLFLGMKQAYWGGVQPFGVTELMKLAGGAFVIYANSKIKLFS